jgi:hypothetical protein
MKIKDRNLIEKLLKVIMRENEGVTGEELVNVIEDMFERKEVYPLFTAPSGTSEGSMTWHLEETEEKSIDTLLDSIRRLLGQSNSITILLTPQCDQCDGMMSKFKSEGGIFSFKCESCKITHEFKLVQESKVDSFEECEEFNGSAIL